MDTMTNMMLANQSNPAINGYGGMQSMTAMNAQRLNAMGLNPAMMPVMSPGLGATDMTTLAGGVSTPAYGQGVNGAPKQPLNEDEEKHMRAMARAVGGSNDLNGDGMVGCQEKEAASHLRDMWKSHQSENQGLMAMGRQDLIKN